MGLRLRFDFQDEVVEVLERLFLAACRRTRGRARPAIRAAEFPSPHEARRHVTLRIEERNPELDAVESPVLSRGVCGIRTSIADA